MLRKLLVPFMLFSLVTGVAISAQEMDTAAIISGAWVRATVTVAANQSEETPEAAMPMGGVSAAYMTIENPLANAIRLSSVETNAAAVVELHETQMQGDVMQMRPVEGGIVIAANESAALQPGGLHVMLLDLQQNLVEGEAIQAALNFEILDDSGEASGETFTQIIGLPILTEPPAPHTLIIQNVWGRPAAGDGSDTMPAGSVSAVYLTIYNPGETQERLIAAETEAADIVEIHEVTMQNDVMQMRPVEGVDIPAGETVALAPGGLHIMLLDVRQPLLTGEAIMLHLHFESGEEISLAVPIYDRLMMMAS